jgi:hypothetical protein
MAEVAEVAETLALAKPVVQVAVALATRKMWTQGPVARLPRLVAVRVTMEAMVRSVLLQALAWPTLVLAEVAVAVVLWAQTRSASKLETVAVVLIMISPGHLLSTVEAVARLAGQLKALLLGRQAVEAAWARLAQITQTVQVVLPIRVVEAVEAAQLTAMAVRAVLVW